MYMHEHINQYFNKNFFIFKKKIYLFSNVILKININEK